MKTLLSIIERSEYVNVSYTGDTFTIYLIGSRRYEITCSAYKEITIEEPDVNYSETDFSVTIETVTFCDDITEEYTFINGDFEDLEKAIECNFENEF